MLRCAGFSTGALHGDTAFWTALIAGNTLIGGRFALCSREKEPEPRGSTYTRINQHNSALHSFTSHT